MSENINFKSEAFAAIHASASALFKAGAIDRVQMMGFDKSCLSPCVDGRTHRQKARVSRPPVSRRGGP